MTTTGAEPDRDEHWAYGYNYRDLEAMDRFEAFEAGVIAGEAKARQNLKGWVLLTGDPRSGFSVIGPFPSEDAALAHASRWEDTDRWPIELDQRGPADTRDA
jgi:hypothetical protein